MGESLSRSLSEYIRQIDIIILGIGLVLFVSGEHSEFSSNLYFRKSVIWIDLVLFISVYVFLTYDWIAYNMLQLMYPYRTDWLGLVRVYIDLFQLFVKSLLVYLATLEISIWHLLLMSLLFLIWNPLIVLWHWLAFREDPRIVPLEKDHRKFMLLYVVYIAVLSWYVWQWGWGSGDCIRYGWTLGLCALIVGTSAFRQHRFVRLSRLDVVNAPPSEAEFEEQVGRLRAVLQAGIKGQKELQQLKADFAAVAAKIVTLERELTAQRPPETGTKGPGQH